MSNLLKQHYIVTASSELRVIDSNQRMEEKMKELTRHEPDDQTSGAGAVSEADGFSEEIEAEQVDAVSQIAADEILEKAKTEAEQILEAARNRADAITSEAQQNAQRLYEEQKSAGYEAGVRQSELELEEQRQALMDEIEQEKAALQMDYRKRSETMEADLVDVILQVFDKVFHIQFEDKKEILLYLIHHTMMNTESGKNFRIRVSETNRMFLQEHLEELRERFGSEVSIEIVYDNNLKDTACLIDTDFGVFDCGLETELANLEKDIRSLCS